MVHVLDRIYMCISEGDFKRMMETMLLDWEIREGQVYCVVRDGDSSLAAGIRAANLLNIHCFLHILNLICKDNMESQIMVVNICVKVITNKIRRRMAV